VGTTNGTGANGSSKVEGSQGAPEEPVLQVRARSISPATATLVRRTGRIAEEAQLRARLELARVLGDHTEERLVGRKLAQRLASHDAEIDAAIELALRTLAAGDDPELRHALAGWLEGLGEPGLAASELRKQRPQDDAVAGAAVLVRIGVLHARAGDAYGAQEALTEAASLDELDALSLELLGAIADWGPGPAQPSPDAPSKRAGAEAYVRAAKRRGLARNQDGEIEDLYRAFELDPSSPLATAALAAAHIERGAPSTADEVLRSHAAALHSMTHTDAETASPAEVHERRRHQALERGDFARAFGAALDEGLDAVFEGPSADAIDDLLVRAGVFEPLAVRLEIRAERAAPPSLPPPSSRSRSSPPSTQSSPPSARATPAERSRLAAQKWADLGRLLSGPLASPERALEAYARSVAADATSTDAVHALRAHALNVGASPWGVEGLVRAAMGAGAYGASPDAGARLAGARALAQLAEE
jgi:hypothetical protein